MVYILIFQGVFMNTSVLSRYLELSKNNPGGGGMSPESACVWDTILTRQTEKGISGHIAEIGVFKGFGAALCCGYLSSNEEALLVDVLDVKEIATPTIKEVTGEQIASRLKFVQSDSMRLRQKQEFSGAFRFVHIDGEHSYDAVINDLTLAEQWLLPFGVVVVDDFFSAACIGVTEAVFDFCRAENDKLVPFLIGYNKAYLCRSRYLNIYRKFVLDLPARLAAQGMLVQLSAGGFAYERTYFGLSKRDSQHPYQLIGRYAPDAESFLNAQNAQ